MRKHWYTITATFGGLIGFFLPLTIDYLTYDGSQPANISWIDYGDRDYPQQCVGKARSLLDQLWFLCWLQQRGTMAILMSTSVALAISLPLLATGYIERRIASRENEYTVDGSGSQQSQELKQNNTGDDSG